MTNKNINPNDKTQLLDSAHDLLNLRRHPLTYFFHPKSVALVGASERKGSVGCATFSNLVGGGFKGPLYPVNPKSPTVLGREAYKSVLDIPFEVDLVVITTPAATVPEIITQCISKNIASAVIISAGFKEIGPDGKKLEDDISKLARGKMRIIGPNCLGIMNPPVGLNATFSQTIANPGNVAFLSQSGALCTAILDWSLEKSIGFSGFVSTGSMADVGWGDLIDYYGADESTKSIVIYMESIGDARSFLSAAREVSLNKPIIVIKAGRTQAAAKAAASHTGSLTGSDEVLDTAFRRCGVLRVNEISEIFDMANILGKQPLPSGRRLTIVTNAGGPGVLATDALVTGGGELASLSTECMANLNRFLPTAWSHGNPVDILGDATAERFAKTLQHIIDEPESDGTLIITTPQGMTNPLEIARQLIPYANAKKPIFASWMGGKQVEEGAEVLAQAGIPTFPFPDAAVNAFNYMWTFRENLKMLYETPAVAPFQEEEPARKGVSALLARIRASGRTLLTEFESKQVLETYAFPVVKTRVAKSADEAISLAKDFGFPVVLKVHSETLTHKTDVGGVALNLRDEIEVKGAFFDIQANIAKKARPQDFLGVTVQPMVPADGYELILGSSVDPQFGPVLLFGLGGQLVEVFKDHSLALPPLTTTLARRMMERTKIYKALHGVRGRKSVDLDTLERWLVRFGQIVINHPEIHEIDINPLLVSENRCLALDARIVLYAEDLKTLPRPAIRPYPSHYTWSFAMKNGETVVVRPIRPEDEHLMIEFHEKLSEETVYSRYLKPFNLSDRTAHERLTRICFIDYDREIALVALKADGEGRSSILAVARLKKNFPESSGELSVVVVDPFQKQGLGLELIRRLVQIAKMESVESLSANWTQGNEPMKAIFERLGFTVKKQANRMTAFLNSSDPFPT